MPRPERELGPRARAVLGAYGVRDRLDDRRRRELWNRVATSVRQADAAATDVSKATTPAPMRGRWLHWSAAVQFALGAAATVLVFATIRASTSLADRNLDAHAHSAAYAHDGVGGENAAMRRIGLDRGARASASVQGSDDAVATAIDGPLPLAADVAAGLDPSPESDIRAGLELGNGPPMDAQASGRDANSVTTPSASETKRRRVKTRRRESVTAADRDGSDSATTVTTSHWSKAAEESREGVVDLAAGDPARSRSDDADPLPQSAELSEQALMNLARIAVREGRFAPALQLLNRHAKMFPHGLLIEERDMLQVVAACRAGRGDQSRRLAKAFLTAHPRSFHRTTVATICVE